MVGSEIKVILHCRIACQMMVKFKAESYYYCYDWLLLIRTSFFPVAEKRIQLSKQREEPGWYNLDSILHVGRGALGEHLAGCYAHQLSYMPTHEDDQKHQPLGATNGNNSKLSITSTVKNLKTNTKKKP